MKQTRLIDKLVAQSPEKGREILKNYHTFEATNVAKFYFEVSDKEYWHYSNDFPNCVPPYPLTFIEFEAPEKIVSREYGTTKWDYNGRPTRWGIGFLTFKIDSEEQWDAAQKVDGAWRDLAKIVPERPSWLMKCVLYLDFEKCTTMELRQGKDDIDSTFMWNFALSADGSLMSDKDGKALIVCATIPWHSDEWTKAYADEATAYIQPALLALSFIHCRNVKVLTNDPPKGLNRKHIKKVGVPLVRYHTIEIEPMRKVLQHTMQEHNTGIHQALHIVRGHFKHYDENGLFGKYKGMWWWESHVQGQPTHGIVLKDYEIKNPNESK